jgi:hypothetical protein
VTCSLEQKAASAAGYLPTAAALTAIPSQISEPSSIKTKDQRGQPFTYDFGVITEKGVTTSSG